MDIVGALLALIPALPLMLVVGLAVKATSRGPVLFRHRRAGRNGVVFDVLKFRTMYHRPQNPGIALTRSGDPRVTPVGRLLRRWKLDELPQIWNVLRGEMGLVGPRPDIPEYFTGSNDSQRTVLRLLPGITSPATLRFRNEEELLATIPPERLESDYVTRLLPQKVRLELEYARSASFLSDVAVLLRTAAAVLR